MKCRVCRGSQHSLTTDLPFKVSDTTIVILRDTPVLQCVNCSEYSIEDAVMEKVDRILESVDHTTELEVSRFAA